MPYISTLAEKFGTIYYGCCDRLNDRLNIVKKIPNLRKILCSPWSNIEQFSQRIGNNLTMSVNPNPALLATDTFDEGTIRADLLRICATAKRNGTNFEIILKDWSTVRFEPKRLERWADIAMGIVMNW